MDSKAGRIEKIELFKVPPRWLFLKITSSAGFVGWGEPIVEGKADSVAASIKELSSILMGQACDNIEDIWHQVYRGGFYRGGPILMSALSGIDQALWDIKGKSLGVPIYQLLGGPVRDRIEIYGWIGGDEPSELAEAARDKINQGFKAVKMNASGPVDWIDTKNQVLGIEKRAQEVRSELGDEYGIAIDFHGRLHRAMARLAIEALIPFKPMFIEEPVLPENLDAQDTWLKDLAVPIAAGERLFSRWDFKTLFESKIIDIAQPDLSHAGGISEVKRIAHYAESYDIALAPHCPLGPISLAAALQIDFSCHNAVIQESSLGIHYNEGLELTDYVSNPEVFELHEGFISLFNGPGLGIDLDEDLISEAAEKGHSWKNPIWRNRDGSITEW